MSEDLKSVAEAINTNWCYFLDMDGDDSDIYIHFFDRMKWFSESKKVKPSPDDIMKYRIIFPVDPKVGPPNSDWDDVFVHGCLYSESPKKKLSAMLDDWGFIDISKVKDITMEEEKVLMT